MKKTYLVQCWDADGALKNHYEVVLEHDRELRDLKKFLATKYGHVVITQATKAKAKR